MPSPPPQPPPPLTSKKKSPAAPPPTPPTDYKTIAEQYAAAKRVKEAEDAKNIKQEQMKKKQTSIRERQREALEAKRKSRYERRWLWTVGFWVWLLAVHIVGLGYFTSGFLLTRLVLDEKSTCDVHPASSSTTTAASVDDVLQKREGGGGGCWHPRTFDRAVIVLIDALRYDFTVPVDDNELFHNAFPFVYETAVKQPNNAFLRPFIADPPTSTLQRLKGLTTGTLPTFVDLGSSFSGTAIEEDNLLAQLRDAGKTIVHLGDDTWESLFPGFFDKNLSHPYESFNVWDLHTVDNGVMEHIFPLMDKTSEWDVLIGHCLGVDHAGHRYGPNHPEMAKKLRQMDGFIRDLAGRIDEKTVLIVMGDHGMDEKGDHGGESDDEVEAALWMYSPKPVFGRTKQEYTVPPGTAKERPVNQIDLVPTLALLMGIPIPYNNLGRPIEEAFAGVDGNEWDNLAAAEWTTAAGIKRYQASYLAARGMTTASTEEPGSPADLWAKAEAALLSVSQQQAKLKPKQRSKSDWEPVYSAFQTYQEETLRRCKSLWARFDLQSMGQGLLVMAFGVISLLLYVAGGQKEEDVIDDPELDAAEKILEAQGAQVEERPSQERQLVRIGLLSASIGGVVGFLVQTFIPPLRAEAAWRHPVAFAALFSVLSVTVTLSKNTPSKLLPRTVWGWLAVIFTLSQSIGFASNSYTIWEDTILLFFQATFGLATTLHSFTLPSLADRYLSIYHSILFVLLGRVASFSKLCREEQMPYCESTYYASSTSSTSSIWQLAIPFIVFLALPSLIKAYLTPTRSYEGLAPTWIGYVFRTGLFLSATYWVLDAADNNQWLPAELPLKNISVYTAQLVLGLAFVAGTTAFLWTPPCLRIITQSATASNRAAQITVLGYGNAHGARYLLLVANVLGGAILVSKPVGGGALAAMMWQIMSLLEILDLNNLTPDTTVIGGVVLAVLGQFYFFKTGHQATLSSIQWDSAFIPLFTIRYPWSPLVVMLNTFAGQIIAVVSVPLLVLWKSDPRKKGILESVSKRALGGFVAYYATEALATMAWAGHLRRHLMLYRVFGPRFMTAAIVLLVVDMMGILVSLTGVRVNAIAVSEVFGWMS